MIRVETAAIWLLAAQLIGTRPLLGQQYLRGRVVDEVTRTGLRGATVTLLTLDSTTVTGTSTDTAGFFHFTLPSPGHYRLTVELVGYEGQARTTDASDGGDQVLSAFVLRSLAIPLDTLEVRTAARTANTLPGLGRASHVLTAERIALLERQGVSIYGAIREIGGGLRTRDVFVQGRRETCVESTRRVMNATRAAIGACDMVVVLVDGIAVGDAIRFLRSVRLSDYDVIEYLPPLQAGSLYGMEASANGALVLWTRRRARAPSDQPVSGRPRPAIGPAA